MSASIFSRLSVYGMVFMVAAFISRICRETTSPISSGFSSLPAQP
jgi:hypothetical protein